MNRTIVLLAGALLAGCQADAATSVAPPSATDPAAAISSAAPLPAAARLALDDAVDRLVPVFGGSREAARLTLALRAFRGAMGVGRLSAEARVTRDAESALASFAKASGASPADVDAIRLALDAAVARH